MDFINPNFPAIHPPVKFTTRGTPYLQSPGIVLLGKTQVDLSGVQPYIDGYDQELGFGDYLQDPPVATPEALLKFAGQLCYMSLGPKRTWNRDTPKYLQHIKQSGHGCYDSETDVLTSDGWVSWPDVTGQHKLATLDKHGSIRYLHPISITSTSYSGRMYRTEGSGVDLLVTPNHNMFVCKTTTSHGRKRNWADYQLIKAEDLNHISHAYLKTGDWIEESSPSHEHISINISRLLGFSIGDGYYPGNGNQVRFHLRRERKISWLEQLVSELGWSISIRGDHFSVDIPDSMVYLFKQIYDNRREKQIPQHMLTNCNPYVLRGLYEGLMQSDGHEGATGDSFDTTSDILADQFQQLCLHIGLAANVCCTYDKSQRQSSYGDKTLIRLSVIRRNLRPEVNKWKDQVGKTSWVENWTGDVYCAEMPHDTMRVLYVRRDGQPVWCGNSVLEHVNLSFLFYGVSRSLTHELVRHRAGMAFSQVSQRYVDGKSLRFVERPEYAADPGMHIEFEQRIDFFAAEYKLMTDMLYQKQTAGLPELVGEHKTDLRKKINQCARSLLPNETEAPIVVTMNGRALRHVLEMRAAAPAETEIRKLFAGVFTVAKEVVPILLDDYAEEALLDGTVALATPYCKV